VSVLAIDPLLIGFLILGIMHTLEPCADKAIVTVYATGFSTGKAKRAITLVLIFGVGMAVSYMMLGVVSAFIGEALIKQVFNPVQILASIVTIMFGVYLLSVHKEEEKCPGEHHHRSFGGVIPAGSPVSAFALGALCGAEPCPLELAAYVWAASAADVLTGLTRMLVFSIGSFIGLLPLALVAGGLSGMFKKAVGERATSKIAGLTLVVIGAAMLMWLLIG